MVGRNHHALVKAQMAKDRSKQAGTNGQLEEAKRRKENDCQ
jgi:hypothetical protein